MRYFRKDAPHGAVLHVNKFGRCPAVGNGSWTPITSSGTLNFLTAATTIRIKAGGDANDTDGGSGAHSVYVQGLDGNFNPCSATLTAAGASASASSTQTFIRGFRAYVLLVGTYGGSNAADITIETTGGTELLVIPAGESQSQHCQYTVPAGHTARIVRIAAEVPSSKDADLRFQFRLGADDVTTPFKPARTGGFRDGVSASERSATYVEGINLPAKTDFWLEAYGNGAGVTASGEMEFYLIYPETDWLYY
ncbi:MAG: hypothetical protein VW405_01620 [Rhodospirillaceae bacterium]